jgi:hypothetical protein
MVVPHAFVSFGESRYKKTIRPSWGIMAQIVQFLRPAESFEPEILEALGKAYEMAIAALHDIGQPTVVREVLAKRIIRAAQKGEHDPGALCAIALAAFNSDKLVR